MSKIARLRPYWSGTGDHAVIISHGITQAARHMKEFADLLGNVNPDLDLFLFDYGWTASISSNGTSLAREIERLDGYDTVSLVGYSMGGLISRFAAARSDHPGLETIITLATPNAGAVSTAQLAIGAQAMLAAGRRITAFAPKQGLADLTRADRLMKELRELPEVPARIAGKRYASVPALYFHEGREAWDFGSSMMGAAAGGLGIFNVLPLMSKVNRPHDGIVTERSCNIADPQKTPISEIDHTIGHRSDPARLHAWHAHALDCDHITVLKNPSIASLVIDLVTTKDWSVLPRDANRRFVHF